MFLFWFLFTLHFVAQWLCGWHSSLTPPVVGVWVLISWLSAQHLVQGAPVSVPRAAPAFHPGLAPVSVPCATPASHAGHAPVSVPCAVLAPCPGCALTLTPVCPFNPPGPPPNYTGYFNISSYCQLTGTFVSPFILLFYYCLHTHCTLYINPWVRLTRLAFLILNPGQTFPLALSICRTMVQREHYCAPPYTCIGMHDNKIHLSVQWVFHCAEKVCLEKT